MEKQNYEKMAFNTKNKKKSHTYTLSNIESKGSNKYFPYLNLHLLAQ